MKPFEIARKYGLSEMYVYAAMRYIEATQGVRFTKKGYRYELTPEEVRLIEKELQRRGKRPLEVTT